MPPVHFALSWQMSHRMPCCIAVQAQDPSKNRPSYLNGHILSQPTFAQRLYSHVVRSTSSTILHSQMTISACCRMLERCLGHFCSMFMLLFGIFPGQRCPIFEALRFYRPLLSS